MSSASLLLLSNALFFVFSLLGVSASVAIFLLVRASERQADRELEAYKVRTSAEISQARVEVEQAKADAASELADAAFANQKAAGLELKIQKERMASAAKPSPHPVAPQPLAKPRTARTIGRPVNIARSVGMLETDISVASKQGDTESLNLAGEIRALFDGGSSVPLSQVGGVDPENPVETPGVHILHGQDSDARRIAKALMGVLSKNKIRCDTTDIAEHLKNSTASDRSRMRYAVRIYVGPDPER